MYVRRISLVNRIIYFFTDSRLYHDITKEEEDSTSAGSTVLGTAFLSSFNTGEGKSATLVARYIRIGNYKSSLQTDLATYVVRLVL